MTEHKQLFIRCDCLDSNHTLVFTYWPDEDEPEVYIDMHIFKGNWWDRLKLAVQYVLGTSAEYGHWHEVVLMREQTLELIDFLREKHDLDETSGTSG